MESGKGRWITNGVSGQDDPVQNELLIQGWTTDRVTRVSNDGIAELRHEG